MKVSKNFDLREFVPKSIWDKWGKKSIWFIDKRMVDIAEFYKEFFFIYFKKQYGDELLSVIIKVNDYLYGGGKNFSGFRPPDYKKGASMSQHRFKSGFDCEIILKFKDGTKKEVDYVEIHKVIQDYEETFMEQGVTCVESVEIAKGWLHTDFRWVVHEEGEIPKILIVKP